MKNLKAVFYVVVCLAAYYSYARADGHSGRDGGRDGHHSGDTTSRDSSRHSGDGDHHGSDDTTNVRSGDDSTEVEDSTEVRHHGDSTEVENDSSDVRHRSDDSTEVAHDSTEVRHGGDDSTHVDDHGGRGRDSTNVDDHGGRGRDSTNVDDHGGPGRDTTNVDDHRGPGRDSTRSDDSISHRHGRGTPAEDVSRGSEHRNTSSRLEHAGGFEDRDSSGHHGESESEIQHDASREILGAVVPPTSFKLFDMNGAIVGEWHSSDDRIEVPRQYRGQFLLMISNANEQRVIKLQIDR